MEVGGALFYQTEDKHYFTKIGKTNFYIVEKNPINFLTESMLLCMVAGNLCVE